MRNVSYHSKFLPHKNQSQARLFFKNNKRINKHFNNCSYSLFFLMKIFQKQLLGGIQQKKLFLKFHNIYSKKPLPVACNFNEKETLLPVLEFCETFKDTFFSRTPPVVVSGLFF